MTLRVLLVDDSPDKIREIVSAMSTRADVPDVVVVGSLAEACAALERTTFDLMLLDMLIPIRNGERPKEDGGKQLLDRLRTNRQLKLPAQIVGITAHEQLQARFLPNFEATLWSLLHYSQNELSWAAKLAEKLDHLESLRTQRDGSSGYRADVALQTALHPVELEAVLSVWPELQKVDAVDDSTLYFEGLARLGEDLECRVVAAAATEMGSAAAATLSAKIIARSRPRILGMCGIAAGTKDAQFGDILFATRCWNYQSGKLSREKGASDSIFAAGSPRRDIDPWLQYQANWFNMREHDWFVSVTSDWNARLDCTPKIEHPLTLRIGALATGETVVADETVVNSILEQDRKTIGIEMEAYGVLTAARQFTNPLPKAFVAKSLCDFGTIEKDDRYQRYAAYTSARFSRAFVEELLRSRPLE